MGKMLVSEQTIRQLIENRKKTLEIGEGTIVTPLAAELAMSKGVLIIQRKEPKGEGPMAVQSTTGPEVSRAATEGLVAIGSDHGGFQFKEELKEFIQGMGYKVVDVGTFSVEPCDYPDFAYAVASMVSAGSAWRGIMMDGAGIGSCVVANKVPGIRAACCQNEFVARNAREHNDTNLLTLGSKVVGIEVCKSICQIWLETLFAGGRHATRVNKITDLESRFLK